jgi:hypothetical protein
VHESCSHVRSSANNSKRCVFCSSRSTADRESSPKNRFLKLTWYALLSTSSRPSALCSTRCHHTRPEVSPAAGESVSIGARQSRHLKKGVPEQMQEPPGFNPTASQVECESSTSGPAVAKRDHPATPRPYSSAALLVCPSLPPRDARRWREPCMQPATNPQVAERIVQILAVAYELSTAEVEEDLTVVQLTSSSGLDLLQSLCARHGWHASAGVYYLAALLRVLHGLSPWM